MLRNEQKNLQAGIEVMRRLTPGKVHLSVRAKAEGQMPMLKGAELHTFAGKHPAGNVGVQIHHIDPVNKGEVVWTVSDITNALMAIPNIIMVLLLSGLIAKETRHYVYEGNLDERDEAPIPQLDSK